MDSINLKRICFSIILGLLWFSSMAYSARLKSDECKQASQSLETDQITPAIKEDFPPTIKFFGNVEKELFAGNCKEKDCDTVLTENGWKVGSELGKGAFGSVYEIFSEKDRNIVAKLEPISETDLDKKLADKINEVEFYKIVSGKNIVPNLYYATFCKRKTQCFFMMIMEKMNQQLSKFIPEIIKIKHKGTLNNEYIVNILNKVISNICKCIRDLHSYGIMHADLHDDNIMVNWSLDETGKPIIDTLKLIDLGKARKMKKTIDITKSTEPNDDVATIQDFILKTLVINDPKEFKVYKEIVKIAFFEQCKDL